MSEVKDPLPSLTSLLNQVIASARAGFHPYQSLRPVTAQGPVEAGVPAHGRMAEAFKASQLRNQILSQVRDLSRFQPGPAAMPATPAPGQMPESQAEPSLISEADLIEMKRVCAANGEAWRLRMICAYEQAVEAIAFMYHSQEARRRMEVRLQQDLLMELGEYCPEA